MNRDPLADNFVVAIDFGGTKIAVAIADLMGELLEQSRIETDASGGALQAMRLRALTSARGRVDWWSLSSRWSGQPRHYPA